MVFTKFTSRFKTIFYAALKNHSITQAALNEFRKDELDIRRIGSLMNDHHAVLKETLKITVPKIDDMINNALSAGAFGAKIIGSGGGGCIVALSSKENEQNIIKALKRVGAMDAFKVEVADGVGLGS